MPRTDRPPQRYWDERRSGRGQDALSSCCVSQPIQLRMMMPRLWAFVFRVPSSHLLIRTICAGHERQGIFSEVRIRVLWNWMVCWTGLWNGLRSNRWNEAASGDSGASGTCVAHIPRVPGWPTSSIMIRIQWRGCGTSVPTTTRRMTRVGGYGRSL